LDIEDDFEEYVDIIAKLLSVRLMRVKGMKFSDFVGEKGLDIKDIYKFPELKLIDYVEEKEEPTLMDTRMRPYIEGMEKELKE
jgi:hypothetical protein